MTGSPGTRRISRNARSVIPMKVGRSPSNLWPRNLSMRLLQLHGLEDVPAQGVDLVALHVRRHRPEDRGVRQGHPRGLGVEDGLRLLVQLGALGDVRGRLGVRQELVELLVAPEG